MLVVEAWGAIPEYAVRAGVSLPRLGCGELDLVISRVHIQQFYSTRLLKA